ncbi:glycosyltransferase family 9 protein, partial [uncultured Amnibacterium sp.]|uniref:glycosyltransferase family 9 protein n=1 Tax=uncultured Amnibacterium sp. TaxID=1631851 RepID=UPI0035CBD530
MRIVVVDTMGGLGDLLLALPLLHALHRTHPAAELVVVTTAPWHGLLEGDPQIDRVVPVGGRDGEAVRAAAVPVLERTRPDLAITTNRQHGLPELLERTAARAITDLWRSPPAGEPVDLRMLRLLVEDGVVAPEHARLPPRIALSREERAGGAAALGAITDGRPVLLFPDSGMRVKHWPLDAWSEVVASLIARGLAPVVVSRVAEQRAALTAAGAVAAPELPLRALAAV